MKAIDVLAHTDVLIGMHGAAWTNTLFLKVSHCAGGQRQARSGAVNTPTKRATRPPHCPPLQQKATALQIFPYGFRPIQDNLTFRGEAMATMLFAREIAYFEWVNPRPDLAFFRKDDANK